MHKVVFAAALAVGLITAPISQFVSSAAAQQVSAEKNAKMKKEPSAGQLATRERQKKCGAEWKEAKASNKIEKGTTCRTASTINTRSIGMRHRSHAAQSRRRCTA